ncbi:MAG: peptidoglycan-binding domain-containing protein [Synechococcales bacterium]|nr:peptidoglycan-binding domain-containing protein [Synechococcales bacterium]
MGGQDRLRQHYGQLSWGVLGVLVNPWVATPIAIVASFAIASPGWALRTQDYTANQFLSVLNGLGYPVANDSRLSDPRVEQAIRDFQLQNDLAVDGIAGAQTQDRAAAIVKALQLQLNTTLKLNPPLPGSQFYGTQTEQAIRLFQERNRLPITGIASLEVRQKLGAAANAPVPETPPTKPSSPVKSPELKKPEPKKPDSTPEPAKLDRSFGKKYTAPDFRAILLGLGYDINPNKPLSDAPAIAAIQDFQKLYGLPKTGVANQATQEKAELILRNLQHNLRLVVKDNEVKMTQRYDEATQAAVRQFQKQIQVRSDGIATLSVRKRLDAEAKRSR